MKKNFSLKPFQPDARISNFRSSFEYLGNGTLNLDFSLEGQVDLLNFVKTSAEPLSWGHDLWRNTCFELFLAFPGFPGYWEWNFSLSGEVCCYSFADYRSHVFLDTSFKDNLGGVLKSSFDKSSTLLRKTIHLNLEILPNFSAKLE